MQREPQKAAVATFDEICTDIKDEGFPPVARWGMKFSLTRTKPSCVSNTMPLNEFFNDEPIHTDPSQWASSGMALLGYKRCNRKPLNSWERWNGSESRGLISGSICNTMLVWRGVVWRGAERRPEHDLYVPSGKNEI